MLVSLFLSLFWHVSAPGNPECWVAGFTFEFCCEPLPEGNPACWDQFYSTATCCGSEWETGIQAARSTNFYESAPVVGDTCTHGTFLSFQQNVVNWFLHRRARLALFQEMTSFARQFDAIFETCTPAALAAFVLKLESIYFETEMTFSSMMDVYLRSYHRAVAEGMLTQWQIEKWQLSKGVDRLLSLRALGRQVDTAPADAGKLVVDVVVCYCDERLIWLKAFHQVPWRDAENRSWTTKAHVGLKIYHKCPANTPAKRDEQRQDLLRTWISFFHSVVVRFVFDAARADDCSAYLAYINDYHESHQLPEYTVFLHADAPEHIPSLELLTDTVFAASRGFLPPEVGFVHLAHNHVNHKCQLRDGVPIEGCQSRDLDTLEFPTLWKNVFDSSVAPTLQSGDVSAYCCVQFLVSRQRIHLRTRKFYSRALEYMGSTAESYWKLFPVGKVVNAADVRGRTPCQLAMYIWHAMFGEPLKLPRRQQDTNLPLFMKMVNIEVEAVLEEPEPENVLAGLERMISGSVEDPNSGPNSKWARMNRLFAGS